MRKQPAGRLRPVQLSSAPAGAGPRPPAACLPFAALKAIPVLIAALVGLLLTGCGDDGEPDAGDPASERSDAAVKPPPGWRSVVNREAGFTIAAPRSWPARSANGGTLIRSGDRLVAVTVTADRSAAGRGREPARYARETLAQLPRFEGSVEPEVRPVRGSPYESALVEGTGSVETAAGREQRVAVAAFQRPEQVTYAAVIFSNPATPPADERAVRRMLRTLRARRPG